MVHIVSMKATTVDEALAKRLRPLTLTSGMMWPTFLKCRDRGWPGRVFIAYEGKDIVGWGLRWKAFPKRQRWTLHVYVDPAHRRRKIGTLIAQASTGRLKYGVKGIPWDTASIGFYNSKPHPKVVS